MFFDFFKTMVTKSWRTKLGMLLLKPDLMAFKHRYDHEKIGGAPLLGVDGVSVIAHGNSTGEAIKNAIAAAIRAVENKIVENIAGDIQA
jgi:glycerol-3-phosphate acyltransferase PlsX